MSEPFRRYLSVWLRRLSTDRIERRLRDPDESPRVIVEPVKSALRLYAMNDAAASLGLKSGMPLADAQAMYPSIKTHPADYAADLSLLEAIADWCDRYTPLIGIESRDGLILDVSGCAHLFGGEREMGRDLIARLARQGFKASVGLADTAGCAWAVARYGEVRLVSPGEARNALLPLPLAALRLGNEAIAALAQAGLKCIADVIEQPRSPLAARYGTDFLRRLDQALGHERESISPRLPPPSYVVEQRFPDPIGVEADVLATVRQLAHELSHIMERHGEGARLFQVALFRADGKVYRLQAGTSRPLRDPERIEHLFVEKLNGAGDECDPGFGYDVIRLAVLRSERLDPTQNGLAGRDHTSELTQLVDRLSTRFGPARMTRLLPCDTHIPEFAQTAVPAQRARSGFKIAPASQDSLAPVRPLRLFEHPELIEVIAKVPDGPPARFRWREVMHDVAAAEGPERIAMEWWRDEKGHALTRDYFRIESKRGARVWLYREGLYGQGAARPRWFMHGLFA